MNSKSVLNKIITLLSTEDKEVKLTFAELADGTVLESPTFDFSYLTILKQFV